MKTVSSEYINTKFNNKEDYRREDERLDGEIFRIADDIALRCKDKPIVLLSGPSGSGKTTTAHKISGYLDEKGHKTHVISLDNYFKTILPDGQDEVDFESPSRIDSKMLSEHIKKISECKEIELPMFDFLSKKSVSSGIKLKRKKGEVVLFEGIHALNPDAVPIDNETSVKIYASVRTRISCGNEIIHPKFIRLLRRMSRDEIYRGRSVSETADYFKSVERGEELYVAPFKRFADYSIDTFIAYEPKIYAGLLLDEIRKVTESKNDDVMKYLEACLANFVAGDKKFIVKSSIIREFIGEN